MLTRNDDGHQTGVDQEQIGTVHELHVGEHSSRVVAHSAVHVADYEGYGEVDGNSQQQVSLKSFSTMVTALGPRRSRITVLLFVA